MHVSVTKFGRSGVVRYLDRMELLWFALLLVLAEVLGTVGGFGSSMLVMPIAGWFLPFTEALGLTAVFHVFSNVSKVILFRQGFSWRVFLPMVLPAVGGVYIGARLTGVADGSMLTLLLGVLLVLLSGVFLLFPTARVEPTMRNAVLGGGLSGLVAGLVGTGGAIRGVTLAAFGLERSAFVCTSAWIDLGVDLTRSVVYFEQGYVNERVWTWLPVLAAVSVVGSWAGRSLLRLIPQDRFRTWVLLLVMLIGLYLLGRQAWPFLLAAI